MGVDVDDGINLIGINGFPISDGSCYPDSGLVDGYVQYVVITGQSLEICVTAFGSDGVMYLLCLDVVDVVIGVKDCYDGIVIGSELCAGINHCLLDDGNVIIGSACGSCNHC